MPPATTATARLLIIDDHPLFVAGLRAALQDSFTLHEAPSLAAALLVLQAQPDIDIALIDLRLPDTRHLEALHELGQRFAQVARVAMSGQDDPALPALTRAAGASGFVHKSRDAHALADSLRRVLDGGTAFEDTAAQAARDLSPRELEVLAMLVRGQSNKEIARLLGITERTVKAHVHAAFESLGARNRTEAARLATQRGLVAA